MADDGADRAAKALLDADLLYVSGKMTEHDQWVVQEAARIISEQTRCGEMENELRATRRWLAECAACDTIEQLGQFVADSTDDVAEDIDSALTPKEPKT